MIKHNLSDQLKSLQLTNSQLVTTLSDIINSNFTATEAGADSVQDKLTNAHVAAWYSGKSYPSNPIIKDALSIFLTGKKGNYANLILPTAVDAEDLLAEAFTVYNEKLTMDFKTFKTNCINGYFDRIKNNPYSSKVTLKDIAGCIAYLRIQGYLYSNTQEKKQKLDLALYGDIVDVNELIKLVDRKKLLVGLQKHINLALKLNQTGMYKTALTTLLLAIRNQEFFD
ncbi:hypothetical protein [Lactobacillus agrestimuris]|uniref:hypothetical protein n=1 Tax=Lactobacillus agrestimuris TaxID=2941328 RepID=UPI00204401FF|nr:hypothetical protein [Lactobacillus agrestimuris]